MRILLRTLALLLLASPAWTDGAIPAPIGLTPFVTSVPNASATDTIANRMAALPNVRSEVSRSLSTLSYRSSFA